MASFAVIKHELHLPFRYDSIIAGAVYNNTDSSVLSGICYAGDAEKPPVPAVFQEFGPSDRIRTCGILLPKQARYQLRYTRMRLFAFNARIVYQIAVRSVKPFVCHEENILAFSRN